MKILVIDDHPLIQEALKHVLAELDASLELIQAHDASSAHAALSRDLARAYCSSNSHNNCRVAMFRF